MGEYRLSKANNHSKLAKVDKKNELTKVSNDTKLIPKTKNYLVKITDEAKVICINTGKSLVKVADKALTVIKNKLAEFDLEKFVLNILKELFFTTEIIQPTQTKRTKVYYTYTTRTNTVAKEYKNEYVNQNNNRQEQIQASKPETKNIEGKSQKSIRSSKETKKIPKKQVKSIPKPNQQPLMIEKQKQGKKD